MALYMDDTEISSPSRTEISSMTPGDLFNFLTEEINIPSDDVKELEKRKIDGRAFQYLTREDFAIIFPADDKFLLASNLYRISQKARMNDGRKRNTQSLLDELSELDDDGNSSHTSLNSSHTSTPCSSRSSSSSVLRKRSNRDALNESFKLPVFSPDLKDCIRKDVFYTTTQRNRLIKEACMALRGYCWEMERPTSSLDKQSLAKSLLKLAPNSLSDSQSDGSSPEAGLYGQITRWFHNHTYLDKKSCNPLKKSKTSSSTLIEVFDDEDEEASTSHLSELTNELKKRNIDESKVARLLSLTFSTRRNAMLALSANVRITTLIKKYPCLNKPIYLLEEMYLATGVRFTSSYEVQQKFRTLQKRWNTTIAPAIVKFAVETGRHHPESDQVNIITMYCLTLLVDKLKPKGGPSASKRLNSLVCFAPTLDEALNENSSNVHPYIVCIGTISSFSSAVAVCNKTVITVEIGQFVFTSILILLALHYTFELSYNPATQQVLEFLQEKLIGDCLPSKKKMTTAYSNLYRALNCFEQKLSEEPIINLTGDDIDSHNSSAELFNGEDPSFPTEEEETQECFDI